MHRLIQQLRTYVGLLNNYRYLDYFQLTADKELISVKGFVLLHRLTTTLNYDTYFLPHRSKLQSVTMLAISIIFVIFILYLLGLVQRELQLI